MLIVAPIYCSIRVYPLLRVSAICCATLARPKTWVSILLLPRSTTIPKLLAGLPISDFSHNKNTIKALSGEAFFLEEANFGYSQKTHKIKVGKPLGQFYGYQTLGVYEVDDFDYEPHHPNLSSQRGHCYSLQYQTRTSTSRYVEVCQPIGRRYGNRRKRQNRHRQRYSPLLREVSTITSVTRILT